MFEFNNTHIFTGYLKQLMSSFNLPSCKVYNNEFADYVMTHGKEDPRIVESFDTINENRLASRTLYLRNNELYSLFYNGDQTYWKKQSDIYYDREKNIPGLTKNLKSPGVYYDTKTHEYLGDFLRFIRDYYDVNLMSLYNCFNNKTVSNIYIEKVYYEEKISETDTSKKERIKHIVTTFDSTDSKYRIFAIPVKLFEKYTIAIDCYKGVEMFCGLYNKTLDLSDKALDLFNKTYQKIDKTIFNQPFLYTKLDVSNWNRALEQQVNEKDIKLLEDVTKISRCDILNREQDLKLFIKIPISCESSITILEGDYCCFNNFTFAPTKKLLSTADIKLKQELWDYKTNHCVINFDNKINLNSSNFKPISKLQLLAYNTGKSYPFSDRLIEYLTGSAISPLDGISDNIKRAQRVMNQNNHYFKIDGIWENKMQKIAYNYMINEGPFEIDSTKSKIIDVFNEPNKNTVERVKGRHPKVGYTSKSSIYDILGYIDRDVEKYYASWQIKEGKASIKNNIQNVDIYDGLFDL